MELSLIRDIVEKAKGVEGYVVLDSQGAVLTQDLGPFANRMKRTEFATWILNCFYAVDTYCPQAACLLLRYATGNLYLTRTENRLITVMCRHGADVRSLENAFSQHRLAMAKSNSSGIVRDKSKKGETVFLKISETGPGATSSPIPPKKSSGPGAGLIIGAVVVVAVIIGVVVMISGGDETPAPQAPPATASATAKPAGKPADAVSPDSARARVKALANIARQQDAASLAAMEMARATATAESAAAEDTAGDEEAALRLWKDAATAYGEAAVKAARAKLEARMAESGLGVVKEFPTPLWVTMENQLEAAGVDAAEGRYSQAVETINGLAGQLPALRQQALDRVSDLASQASAENNVDAALQLYHKVLAIDSENAAAKEFIYMNRFEPGETITNGVGMVLAYIPPGKYTRGSPESEAFRDTDETAAPVALTAGFFMATTEVTQAQWEDVMGQRMRMEDPESDFIGGQLPVHSITWEQATEFCRRLSKREGKTYRLPTEAEWEYAARAGTTSAYNNGRDRISAREANVYDPSGEGLDTIAAVGSVGRPNAWGLYDMHGNVWEWTADWSAPYPDSPQTDPQGPEASDGRVDLAMKIVRGGSFIDDAPMARSANRSEASPVVANTTTGFRPVMVVADI